MSRVAGRSTALLGPRPIEQHEFTRFQAWIHSATGIHLTDQKQALLVGRLWRRVRELGLPDYGSYLDLVEAGRDPEERTRLINAICTHETQFFREPYQFAYLEEHLIPWWRREAAAGRRGRSVRVWSAACSSGEEPYSLAMCLLAHLPATDGWKVEIMATDLSTKILARARVGEYPIARAEGIPQRYLKRFMLKGRDTKAERCAVGPELRQAVRFRQLNLHEGRSEALGSFDLILCRNVLIYFTLDGRGRVMRSLLRQLGPGGRLFLGHAETLNGIPHPLHLILPTIYGAPEDPR